MNLVDILQMSKEDARTYLEKVRWPNGPMCPWCDRTDNIYKLGGKTARPGVYCCRSCRTLKMSFQFTVTVGTIFEDSHLPMNKWIGAFYLMCSSKKGVSANQLHRSLGITYKSAWFMAHRIRLAMKPTYSLKDKMKGVIEADETYVGGKARMAVKNKNKYPVLALVQRGGQVRAKAIKRVTSKNLRENLQQHVDPSAVLMTDEHKGYIKAGKRFKEHHTLNHGLGEYVRGTAYTNTAESFFALLKRGVYGTFHHVSGKHLPKYTDEFAFRWNNRKNKDGEIVENALKSSGGKRMTYVNRLNSHLHDN